MKALFLAAMVLGLAGVCEAAGDGVNRSSFTLTDDTLQVLGLQRATIYSVVVGSVTTNGQLRLYDSNGTATGQIANIDLGARGSYHFDVRVSSGLTYTTSGNGSGVTINFR